MNNFFTLLFVSTLVFSAKAQTPAPATPTTQPYGTVSKEDLEMKACEFEKDANAEILFDKGDLYFSTDLMSITEQIHQRIKIFNDKGKDAANISIKFYTQNHLEYISNVQAETINLIDGKQEITKLDKKLIYTRKINKVWSEVTFAMPNVRPGSIIEYKYDWNTNYFNNFPGWFFQKKMPVRYSEIQTSIPDVFNFKPIFHLSKPLIKYKTSTDGRSLQDGTQSYPYTLEIETRAMADIRSLQYEPYMSSFNDNVESLSFQLVSIKPIGGFQSSRSDTWARVAGYLIDDPDFGGQLKRKINGEDIIINKAKDFKTDDEKIAYIFNAVKNTVKWNGENSWYTYDGTYRAWENKAGNAAEVNFILYHLLRQAGVNAYPMIVSTKDNGRVNMGYASLAQFNKSVVYVHIDTLKSYVLDATGKYNMFNQIPAELLNSEGLYIDKDNNKFGFFKLRHDFPEKETVSIVAEIKDGGKLGGTAQISGSGYYKVRVQEKYKANGEKLYIDSLRDGDNNLKITSLKLENMDVDTLPLIQKIDFDLNLTGADEKYIYFNSNLFTSLKTNPFLNEIRNTNIDFVYPRTYLINGIYKLPAGYKLEALPKSVNMAMPDKSFEFRRLVAEQDGSILIRYNIYFNVVMYSKMQYAEMRDFFKKMTEMLNEQIILKKI